MSIRSMTSALGLDVIGLDSAESVGEVKAFVLGPDASKIERVQVAGRGRHPIFAEWSDLESFGRDAVMVKHAGDPSESDDDRDVEVAKGKIDIIGARILDTAGTEQGTVADVDFDDETGAVLAVSSDGDVRIDAPQIRSFGSYALVVDH